MRDQDGSWGLREIVEALAEDRLDGEDHLEALDWVLADPLARSEYLLLCEIGSARRARADLRSCRWLIAVAILVATGGGLLWGAYSPAGPGRLGSRARSVCLATTAAPAAPSPLPARSPAP
jgi:hypothetical protein